MAHHLPVLTVVMRLGLALLLAAILGVERELAAQPAGLRTHTLVSLGAALFTLVGAETLGTDPTRIAAQVVTGIGFLGGGAILREGANVRGLTTAATLWTAAAIGLACGLGAYPAAAAGAVATLLITIGLKRVEHEFFPRRRGQLVSLTIERDGLAAVVPAARALLPPTQVISIKTATSGEQSVELRARPAADGELPILAEKLLALDGVLGVELRK